MISSKFFVATILLLTGIFAITNILNTESRKSERADVIALARRTNQNNEIMRRYMRNLPLYDRALQMAEKGQFTIRYIFLEEGEMALQQGSELITKPITDKLRQDLHWSAKEPVVGDKVICAVRWPLSIENPDALEPRLEDFLWPLGIAYIGDRSSHKPLTSHNDTTGPTPKYK